MQSLVLEGGGGGYSGLDNRSQEINISSFFFPD